MTRPEPRPRRASVYKAQGQWTYDLVKGSWRDLPDFRVVDCDLRWFSDQPAALDAACARLKEEARDA